MSSSRMLRIISQTVHVFATDIQSSGRSVERRAYYGVNKRIYIKLVTSTKRAEEARDACMQREEDEKKSAQKICVCVQDDCKRKVRQTWF